MGRRTRNTVWIIPDSDKRNWEHVSVDVLQDIRDELQEIVGLLRCYRILRMFNTIERIDKRLKKRTPL